MTIRRQKEISFKKSQLLEKFRKITEEIEVINHFDLKNTLPNILIIDPHLVDSRNIESCFKIIDGFHVSSCQSEFSALKILKQRNFSMIFINGHLKHFDSFRFAESIRILIDQEIPVVFFSDDLDFSKEFYLDGPSNSLFLSSSEIGLEKIRSIVRRYTLPSFCLSS